MALNLRPTGARLPFGEWFNDIINVVNGLTGGTGSASSATLAVSGASALHATTVTDLTQDGVTIFAPQVLAAAGTTQGAAGAITKSRVIVTVTASTQGVKLPTAATGKEVRVHVPGTVGVKVYPATNGKIDAGSTNAAQALAAGKANIFYARDTTRWVTLKGA